MGILRPLVVRDFKLRYQNSFLGLAWILIEPMLLVMTMSAVFALLGRSDHGGVPYPLYFYSAVLPWNLFKSALVSGGQSFVKDASLVNSFAFSRQVILVKNWLVYFVEFAIAGLGFLLTMLLYGRMPTWDWVMLGPLLLLQCALSLGIMLAVATATVYVRDVGIITGTVATLWFWATPIVFQFPNTGPGSWVAVLNPMAGLIDGYRSVLTRGEIPTLTSLLPAIVATAIALVVGCVTFRRMEGNFSDVL